MNPQVPLRYRIASERVHIPSVTRSLTQFLMFDREMRRPHMLGCHYGAHLALTTKKPNTAKKQMEAASLIMSWADEASNPSVRGASPTGATSVSAAVEL